MPAMIQKRMMTVVSGQPMSSKWWWIGAMRKMRRLLNSRKLPICSTTDTVSMTLRPQTSGSSSMVFVASARQRERGADGRARRRRP